MAAVSREQFIDDWIRDERIEDRVVKTPWGYYYREEPDVAIKAVRCRCGKECCHGWVMKSTSDIAWRKANKIPPPYGQEE